MENLRNVTLVFLVKKNKGKITDICLAMKKRGFGVNRWNGVGGKLKSGESIIEAAKEMWPDDIYWIPEVLKGNLLKATFQFGQNDTVDKKEVNIVESI
ncbi:MAG: hypothetical protein NTW46_04045 [Candidatus Nealsonbacteria bacterium]|nr:hypothetical protein [Candidatus Nealsonbacteria bacterium]